MITIGIDEKGHGKLLHGPEVPAEKQHGEFTDACLGDVPKGFAKIRIYDGSFRETTGLDRKAEKNREAGHIIDSDGKTYPAKVYAERVKWREEDNEARIKHDHDPKTKGTPYKSKTKIPE